MMAISYVSRDRISTFRHKLNELLRIVDQFKRYATIRLSIEVDCATFPFCCFPRCQLGGGRPACLHNPDRVVHIVHVHT